MASCLREIDATVLLSVNTSRDDRGIVSAPALLALLACSGACTAPSTTIEGSDEHAFFPSLRGTFTLDEWKPTHGSGAADDSRMRFTVVDVDVSRSEGDFDQTLAAGESVELDDTLFTGPATVAFDVELVRAAALLRAGLRERRLDLGASIGLAFIDLDLEGSSGAQRDEREDALWALALGLELGWRALDELRLYARAGSDASPDEARLDQFELGAEWELARTVALSLGWREWDFELEEVSESDLDIELSGPVLTLRFSP